MLAALFVNFYNRRTSDGEIWKPERQRVYQQLEDVIKRKLYDREKWRSHLQDTLERVKDRGDAQKRIEELLGANTYDQIIANDFLMMNLQALYLDYLDDEEVLIYAATVL